MAGAPDGVDPPPSQESTMTATTTTTTTRTTDLRVRRMVELPTPSSVLAEMPLPDDAAALVSRSRAEVQDILAGRDDRLLVVVGPCSTTRGAWPPSPRTCRTS
jgi:3-deoxy-7-phosphoheptulonate synthase